MQWGGGAPREGGLRHTEEGCGSWCSWSHWEQGREGTLGGVSAGARYTRTGWAHGVREGLGRGCLEGTVWQEHSCEPSCGRSAAGPELMELSSAPQSALGRIGGPSSELMPPGARGNHFEMKVMIQLVVIHQVQLSFLGLGSREAE